MNSRKNSMVERNVGDYVEFKDIAGDWCIGKLTTNLVRDQVSKRTGYNLVSIFGDKYFSYRVRDVQTPEVKTKRSEHWMQFPFDGVDAKDIRDAAAAVGYRGASMTMKQRIEALTAMGFNSIETRSPSARPDNVKARPSKMPTAVGYVLDLGIANALSVHQHWATETEIFLTCDGDRNVVKKLTAIFGEPDRSPTFGGNHFVFAHDLGYIQATQYKGEGGKSFGISLINN